MDNKKLLEEMEKLGVPMMVPEETVNVSKTLADVVKSHDARLWENFPALLAKASEKYEVNLAKVQAQLSQSDQKALDKLSALSKELYNSYHVQFSALNKFLESFKKVSDSYSKALKPLRDALAHDTDVPVMDLRLSTERLKNSFENYLSFRNMKQQEQNAKHKELSLEYSLSKLFSPKQKELFYKRLNREKMTKTEREYYYRVVKKKVQALANPELHRLAQKLMDL